MQSIAKGFDANKFHFKSKTTKFVLFLAAIQICAVFVFSFFPASPLLRQVSLAIIAFENFMASIYCFSRIVSAKGIEKFGWVFVGLGTTGIFINGMDNLFIDSQELVSPVAVTLLSMMLGVGVLLILWNYLIPNSKRRLLVDTTYLTLIMILSLFYTAFLPFYTLSFASRVEIIAVLTLLSFMCVSIALGIAIMSQSKKHINLFIALPLIAMTLVLTSTSRLLWIQLNNQNYRYFGFPDNGFHIAFISLMILPHIKRPQINAEKIQPLQGIKAITFGPIFLSAPILFLSAPPEARIIIFAGSILLSVLAFKVVAVDKENRELTKKILKITQTDYLTGTLNRRGLQRYLQQLEDLSQLYLIYIDLDEFKQVNDTHGHDVGDALLNQFAENLKNSLRSSDNVARVGGDEFIALINQIEPPNLDQVITRIRNMNNTTYTIKGNELAVRLTAAIVKGTKGIDAQELIRNADQVVLANKRIHKGTVSVIPTERR